MSQVRGDGLDPGQLRRVPVGVRVPQAPQDAGGFVQQGQGRRLLGTLTVQVREIDQRLGQVGEMGVRVLGGQPPSQVRATRERSHGVVEPLRLLTVGQPEAVEHVGELTFVPVP